MKKNVFYLLLFVMPFTAYTQSSKFKKTDWEKSGLKGKVASFNETKYSVKNWKGVEIKDTVIEQPKSLKYNNKGYITDEITYEIDGSLADKWQYAYDANNNQVEGKRFNIDDEVIWNFTSKYNNKNNQTETLKYEEGSLIGTTKYKYDSKYNCIEIISESEGVWKETFSYDPQGNKKQSVSYNPEGKMVSKETYKYDKRHNMIEKMKYGMDGTVIGKETYKYDDKGNQIEYLYYSTSGNLLEKNSYTYDNKQNVIEHASFRADGTLAWKINYEYIFIDLNYNWTLKQEIINGKTESMTYREFSYF